MTPGCSPKPATYDLDGQRERPIDITTTATVEVASFRDESPGHLTFSWVSESGQPVGSEVSRRRNYHALGSLQTGVGWAWNYDEASKPLSNPSEEEGVDPMLLSGASIPKDCISSHHGLAF